MNSTAVWSQVRVQVQVYDAACIQQVCSSSAAFQYFLGDPNAVAPWTADSHLGSKGLGSSTFFDLLGTLAARNQAQT